MEKLEDRSLFQSKMMLIIISSLVYIKLILAGKHGKYVN